MRAIDDFLRDLVEVPSTEILCNVYHPDEPGSAMRVEALRQHLVERWDAPLIFVGEAPGHLGARRSGVAFTDERTLTGEGFKEVTATRMHDALRDFRLQRAVLLWNVVPFHPHRPGEPMSNRRPKAFERRLHQRFAERLAEGRRLVCVGRQAAKSFPDALCLRHPARSGNPQFRRDVERLAATLDLSQVRGTLPS